MLYHPLCLSSITLHLFACHLFNFTCTKYAVCMIVCSKCMLHHPPTRLYPLRDCSLCCVYDFNSKLACHYFRVFSFFFITEIFSCPHNNPIFSPVCLVQFVMSCHRHRYDCMSLWSNLFLLFYFNCSIIMLLWVPPCRFE